MGQWSFQLKNASVKISETPSAYLVGKALDTSYATANTAENFFSAVPEAEQGRRSSLGSAKTDSSATQDSVDAKHALTRLSQCKDVLTDLGGNTSFINSAKNRKVSLHAAQELHAVTADIKKLLKKSDKRVVKLVNVSQSTVQQLQSAVKEAEGYQASIQEGMVTLESHNAEIQTMKVETLQNKELLKSRDDAVQKLLRSVSAILGPSKPQRGVEEEPLERLCIKLQELAAANESISLAQDGASRQKEDVSRKMKELQDKLRSTTEAHEHAIRKLNLDIRKQLESKSAELQQEKSQGADASSQRIKELRALQSRYDAMKAQNEDLKSCIKSLKLMKEKVKGQIKMHEESQDALSHRLNVVKTSKEDTLRELEMLKKEHGMLHEVYLQLSATQIASNSNQAFFTTTQQWPRVGYVMQDGKCLHRRPCSEVDISKLTAFEYRSHAELEALIGEMGAILCRDCAEAPGF